jgi:drug/metabolite transporter (DMT)-like permease
VSAAVLGYARGERLGARGAIGAAVILLGIAVAEAPVLRRASP